MPNPPTAPLAIALLCCLAPAAGALAQSKPAPYELTQKELAFDCKRLTGHMKVRIMQMREMASRPRTSDISRTMQSTVRPVLGGSRHGADPDGDLARDRVKLEAYNRQLAAKKCKTLDIDAELKGAPPAPPTAPAGAAPGRRG